MALVSTTLLMAQVPAEAPAEVPAVAAKPAAPVLATLKGTCEGHDPTGKQPVRLSLWFHDYRQEGAQLVRDVRAANDGTFTLADVPWVQGHDWGQCFFILIARQGDRVGIVYLRGEKAAAKPIAMAMATGATATGNVHDDTGKPIAGASVKLVGMKRDEKQHPSANLLFFAEPLPTWTTTTAADGTFALANLPAGWSYIVEAVSDTHVRTRQDVTGSERCEFTLAPAAVIEGRVVHASGKPAIRTLVQAQSAGAGNGWTTARTQNDGTYRLLGLPAGRYNIWAVETDLTVVAIDSHPATAGQSTAVPDLVLVPGGFITGTVVDADTGKPVQPGPRGDVAMYGPARPQSGGGCECEAIQPDGTFRLRVAPGSSYVYLRAGAGWQSVGPNSFDVEVAAAETKVIEFRVRRPKARK